MCTKKKKQGKKCQERKPFHLSDEITSGTLRMLDTVLGTQFSRTHPHEYPQVALPSPSCK